MKKITRYIVLGCAALALVGCKDKMRELNTKPETIGSTDPTYMFVGATVGLDLGRSGGSFAEYSAGRLFQYWSGFSYCNPRTGEYVTSGQAGDNWTSYYKNFYGQRLVSLQVYIKDVLKDDPKYKDMNAITGVLKMYETFRLFENFGAAIYTEAFKAISEGISTPKYDLLSLEMYHALDAELGSYIEVLAADPEPGTAELLEYDYIYGWKVAATGAPTKTSNYTAQRANWKKFGNALRMDMAWRFLKIDESYSKNVMSQVLANPANLMENSSEGAYFHHQYDITTNSDDISEISISYYVSDNFIAQLKRTNDPRLPLLARANSLCLPRTADDDKKYENAYHWVTNFFPDSLQQRWVYDKANDSWSQKNWNGLLDANGSNPFQGMTADPGFSKITNANTPGMLWSGANITLNFYQPGYKPNDDAHNNALPEWILTGADGKTYKVEGHSVSKTLNVASHAQGRYYVQGGGKNTSTNTGGNGGDGPANQSNIYMRRPMFTYAEQCFMLAYLTEDGITTGKTSSEWYNIAVKEAMQEIQADAVRYEVQIATNKDYSYVQGLNETNTYSLTDKIDAFLAANSLDNASDKKEAIVAQAWVYLYTHPVKMWNWWRMTGYPKIASVVTPAQRPSYPYLTEPHEGGETVDVTKPLAFPRRATVPTPDILNNQNFQNIQTELMKQPNFGVEFGATTGRVIWDVTGL